ncbi:MAG TPA: hypothetical protein VM715_21940, partial [Candidatus Acidoferrum sp.]|nr:hypothetical protein [Candidatus Acidoferrum sp.]
AIRGESSAAAQEYRVTTSSLRRVSGWHFCAIGLRTPEAYDISYRINLQDCELGRYECYVSHAVREEVQQTGAL